MIVATTRANGTAETKALSALRRREANHQPKGTAARCAH